MLLIVCQSLSEVTASDPSSEMQTMPLVSALFIFVFFFIFRLLAHTANGLVRLW